MSSRWTWSTSTGAPRDSEKPSSAKQWRCERRLHCAVRWHCARRPPSASNALGAVAPTHELQDLTRCHDPVGSPRPGLDRLPMEKSSNPGKRRGRSFMRSPGVGIQPSKLVRRWPVWRAVSPPALVPPSGGRGLPPSGARFQPVPSKQVIFRVHEGDPDRARIPFGRESAGDEHGERAGARVLRSPSSLADAEELVPPVGEVAGHGANGGAQTSPLTPIGLEERGLPQRDEARRAVGGAHTPADLPRKRDPCLPAWPGTWLRRRARSS